MIKRNFRFKSRSVMLPLYKSIVRPHMDYCVQAWRPHYRKDIDKLEKVQRRATKMVEGLEGYSYSDRLRILGLTTLETRFLRADLIEVFKILKGFENVEVLPCGSFLECGSFLGSSSRLWEMMAGEGMSSSCSRKGADWMLGDSSLRIGCVRSGMGWMMMWLGLGQ